MRFHIATRASVLVASLALLATMAAPAAAQSAGWQPGPGAVLDNTYTGFIDAPTAGATVSGSGSFQVIGWFVDTTAEGWAGADNVQVWLGTMDGGGKMLAQAMFAQPRPDVAAALNNGFWAASGFIASVPGSSVPSGTQTLYVYVHTASKGWWFKTVSVTGGGSGAAAPAPVASGAGAAPTLVITAPTEGQNVSAKGGVTFTITGTATDPVKGASAIDTVDVWIFGERGTDSGIDLGSTTVDASGNWSVSFKPTVFPDVHANIYVYAHSTFTNQTTEQIRGFNIVG
jgi:Big-like domain-containing protein